MRNNEWAIVNYKNILNTTEAISKTFVALKLINDYLNTKTNSVPDLYLKKALTSFIQQAEYIRENNLFDGKKRSHTLEKRKTLEIFDLIKEQFLQNIINNNNIRINTLTHGGLNTQDLVCGKTFLEYF
jgi:hypothetical protein